MRNPALRWIRVVVMVIASVAGVGGAFAYGCNCRGDLKAEFVHFFRAELRP